MTSPRREPRSKQRRIVIIGGGFSGAALSMELVAAGDAATETLVIGRAGRLGPGLAYSTADRGHLLNVHASRMSALPDAPDESGGAGANAREPRLKAGAPVTP